jgi:hypothetical protein
VRVFFGHINLGNIYVDYAYQQHFLNYSVSLETSMALIKGFVNVQQGDIYYSLFPI